MSRLTAAAIHSEEQRLPHDRQELSDEVARSQSLQLTFHHRTARGDVNCRCEIACNMLCRAAIIRRMQGAD